MKTILVIKKQKDNGAIDHYILTHDASSTMESPFWLGNTIGEGMEMSEESAFDMIDKHFQENF